jgi:hypothetical protein
VCAHAVWYSLTSHTPSSLNLVAVARILELVAEFIHLPNIFVTVTLYSPIGSTASVYGKCCCTISRTPPHTETVHDGARTWVAPRMRRPFAHNDLGALRAALRALRDVCAA